MNTQQSEVGSDGGNSGGENSEYEAEYDECGRRVPVLTECLLSEANISNILYQRSMHFSGSRKYRSWVGRLSAHTDMNAQNALDRMNTIESRGSYISDRGMTNENVDNTALMDLSQKLTKPLKDPIKLAVSRQQTMGSRVKNGKFKLPPPKDFFNDRWTFILAVIASMSGLEQVVRFPQAVGNHSAAFFICYLVCLLGVAFPILRLELYLGQLSQKCFITSLGGLNDRSRGLACSALLYAAFRGWYTSKYCAVSMLFFGESFAPEMPWIEQNHDYCSPLAADVCAKAMYCQWSDQQCTMMHCMQTAAHLEKQINAKVFQHNPFDGLGGLSTKMLLLLLVVWVLVYAFVFTNPMSLGFVLSVSVVLWGAVSFVVMVCFFASAEGIGGIRRAFSPNAKAFVEVLQNFGVWSSALDTALGSLLCGTGVIPVVASYAAPTQNVVSDSWWILFASFGISMMYCMIYFIGAKNLGVTPESSWLPKAKTVDMYFAEIRRAWGGSFATLCQSLPAIYLYPQALSKLTSASVVSILFFFVVALALLLSIVMITEAIMETLIESRAFAGIPKFLATLCICVILYTLSLIHAVGIGWSFSDFLSAYIRSMIGLIIVFFETISAGWLHGVQEQARRLGKGLMPLVIFFSFYLVAIVTTPIIWRIYIILPKDYYIKWHYTLFSFIFFVVTFLTGLGIATYQCAGGGVRLRAIAFELLVGNVDNMRLAFTARTMEEHPNDFFFNYLTFLWPILIKFLIPQMCCFVFCTNLFTTLQSWVDPSRPSIVKVTPIWWIVSAVVVSFIILIPLTLGYIRPSLFDWTKAPSAYDEGWTVSTVRQQKTLESERFLPPVRFFDGFRSPASILGMRSVGGGDATPLQSVACNS